MSGTRLVLRVADTLCATPRARVMGVTGQQKVCILCCEALPHPDAQHVGKPPDHLCPGSCKKTGA